MPAPSTSIASPPPAAAPVFPAGFGPYRYPPIAVGETTRLQLPAALVTAAAVGSANAATPGGALFDDDTLASLRKVTAARPV